MSYKLVCVSLDGEKVTEGEFPTISDAQHRSEFMGSRWWFYPIHVVTGKIKILDIPDYIEYGGDIINLAQFKGKNITTLIKFLKKSFKDVYGLNSLDEDIIFE
jgi:hypothetical protein